MARKMVKQFHSVILIVSFGEKDKMGADGKEPSKTKNISRNCYGSFLEQINKEH